MVSHIRNEKKCYKISIGITLSRFFCNAINFVIGCPNNLPSVMSKNKGCKRLKLSCTKLKSKCNSKLGAALGNSNLGKICKNALKGNAQKRVNEYCQKTCRKCGKLSNDYYANTVKEFHNIMNSCRLENILCNHLFIFR